jgi:mannosyltransferase
LQYPGVDDRRRNTLLLAAIVAVGAWLRFHNLGAPSFWLDEALSVVYARLPWSQFAHLMRTRELNMLPYYLLLRAWIHLGSNEWTVRALSALCSIATLPLFYALGARLFGTRAGLLGVAILALHPWHIAFAQEARGYSLMLLLVTSSTLLLVRTMESTAPRFARAWGAYVAVSALASYAHFFASLTLLAQWASLAIARPRDTSRRALALAIAAVCILLLPLAAFVVLGHADPAEWIPTPDFRRIDFLIFSLLGAGSARGEHAREFLPYAVALCGSVLAIRDGRRRIELGRTRWHFALVVAGATLPIALVLLVSIFKPIFVDKYLIECLPFVVLLLAIGIERLRPRWLSLLTLLSILAICAVGLAKYYGGSSTRDDWRAASRYIVSSARPGDAALFYPSFTSAPFEYYRARLAATSSAAPAASPRDLGDDALRDALAPGPHSYSRLWAVFNHEGDSGRVVRDSLAARYPVLSERQFTGLRVMLFDTR